MAGVGLAALGWFLLQNNPGGQTVKERAKEAHDSLLDFLVSLSDEVRPIHSYSACVCSPSNIRVNN